MLRGGRPYAYRHPSADAHADAHALQAKEQLQLVFTEELLSALLRVEQSLGSLNVASCWSA